MTDTLNSVSGYQGSDDALLKALGLRCENVICMFCEEPLRVRKYAVDHHEFFCSCGGSMVVDLRVVNVQVISPSGDVRDLPFAA
jgi:hypothetical protein